MLPWAQPTSALLNQFIIGDSIGWCCAVTDYITNVFYRVCGGGDQIIAACISIGSAVLIKKLCSAFASFYNAALECVFWPEMSTPTKFSTRGYIWLDLSQISTIKTVEDGPSKPFVVDTRDGRRKYFSTTTGPNSIFRLLLCNNMQYWIMIETLEN